MHTTKTDVSSLIQVLSRLYPLSPEIQQFFETRLTSYNCRRETLLLKEGEICNHLYFIKKGVIRGYIKQGNKDITTWISADNEVVTSIAGLNQRAASPENIQTIENCELLVLTIDDLNELYTHYLEFNIVGRKLLELYYHDAELRAFISRLPGADQKYKYFINRYHHLINRIPLKHVASFLGITLETLSRVRGRISS